MSVNMSRNNSVSSLQGLTTFHFSIFQPSLGDALQWFPVLGSRELDEMLHTFVPGPQSIQDKRATVAMDFFEYSRLTGENFKLYTVYNYAPSFSSSAVDSPASSSAMYDSGYGSSFDVSPIAKADNVSPYTPSSFTAATPSSSTSTAPKKSASSTSRSRLDFSNHPGMRILTKDGQDVTDSAGRGGKTKEQRDHAHLMRVIKACDACRRKKTRCDPSHKRRTASQSQSSPAVSKSMKKAKTTTAIAAYEQQIQFVSPASDNLAFAESPELPVMQHNQQSETPDDFWTQFVNFDATIPQPEEFSSFNPTAGQSSYATVSAFALSSSRPSVPFSPAVAVSSGDIPLVPEGPALPYLFQGGDFVNDYQDFNLYSPASDFMDEEPQLPAKSRIRMHTDHGQLVVEQHVPGGTLGQPGSSDGDQDFSQVSGRASAYQALSSSPHQDSLGIVMYAEPAAPDLGHPLLQAPQSSRTSGTSLAPQGVNSIGGNPAVHHLGRSPVSGHGRPASTIIAATDEAIIHQQPSRTYSNHSGVPIPTADIAMVPWSSLHSSPDLSLLTVGGSGQDTGELLPDVRRPGMVQSRTSHGHHAATAFNRAEVFRRHLNVVHNSRGLSAAAPTVSLSTVSELQAVSDHFRDVEQPTGVGRHRVSSSTARVYWCDVSPIAVARRAKGKKPVLRMQSKTTLATWGFQQHPAPLLTTTPTTNHHDKNAMGKSSVNNVTDWHQNILGLLSCVLLFAFALSFAGPPDSLHLLLSVTAVLGLEYARHQRHHRHHDPKANAVSTILSSVRQFPCFFKGLSDQVNRVSSRFTALSLV